MIESSSNALTGMQRAASRLQEIAGSVAATGSERKATSESSNNRRAAADATYEADLAEQQVEAKLSQVAYQANARVLEATREQSGELLNILA